MKSNKKHHGHTNPNHKQKQANKSLNENNNNQVNESAKAPASDNSQEAPIGNNVQFQPDQSLLQEDENLPVVSDDQSVADIINEENEQTNVSKPFEPTHDLTKQTIAQEQAQSATESSPDKTSKPVQISSKPTSKKLGIVIIEHNCQTKIKELMANLESQDGFSNDDINVYIWDESSTDYSRAYIAGLSKRYEIHYIFNDNEEGMLCARNNMFKWINDDYILCMGYRDELVNPALKEFFEHYGKNDFMMLKRNIMQSLSKQMVDIGVYKDKGSKSATFVTKTPYSFVTGIFVAKEIYQKVRDLVDQNYEYAKDIRFYEDMVVYPFWVYFSKSPCFLNSYYNYNIMGHDYYLLTDVCKQEQHQNSLKAIYAIDKIQKDAGIHDEEFDAMKYTMDIRLINTYWSTGDSKKEKLNDKVQELIHEFIKPIKNPPALLSKDKTKFQLVSNIHLQRIYHLIHK